MKLGLHQLARRQHGANLMCRQRFAMIRPKRAKPHQLGDALGILAVGIDRHRLKRIGHMTRLEQFDGEATFSQTCIQPLWQWAASKQILESGRPKSENQTISASGSLPTVASCTIEPSASTMQKLDCSNQTSMPQFYPWSFLKDASSRPALTPGHTIILGGWPAKPTIEPSGSVGVH